MTSISSNQCAFLLLFLMVAGSNTNNTKSVVKAKRPSIVSFQSLDKHVLLGLDLVVPFLTMPVGKHLDKHGNERALINIDTSALIVTSLVTGGSIAVSHLFRSLGILAEPKEAKDEKETKRAAKSAHMDIFEPFKIVYVDSGGEKVETSLSQLFNSLEETFLEKNIDLSECMQKSICIMVNEAHVHVKSGTANGVDKIIDGFVNLQWFQNLLQHTAMRAAIDAGKFTFDGTCDTNYPRCSWSAPHIKLLQILKTNVKFT